MEILSTFHYPPGCNANNWAEPSPHNCFFSMADLNSYQYTNPLADHTHHPKWHLTCFMHFYTTMPQSPHWLQWDVPSPPPKLPLPVATRPTTTNGISLASTIMSQYTTQTDWPTAPVTCCVPSGHLRSIWYCDMAPKKTCIKCSDGSACTVWFVESVHVLTAVVSTDIYHCSLTS